MKNLRYTSYRRNRYFQGKLLTAGDLEEEQRYFNNKRRLHNRYFHGAGVVTGLEVIVVDDYSISLEVGVAVDGSGREIVVEEPGIFKLAALEGFQEAVSQEGSESLNLYLAYKEEQAEPVHNMMDQSLHTSEEMEYNKVKEGYYLYVSDDCPELFEPQEESLSRAEWIKGHPSAGGICLAGIDLVKAGEFYMIEKIRPMPENQTAGNLPDLLSRLRAVEAKLLSLKQQERESGIPVRKTQEKEADSISRSDWQLEQGMAVISFGKRGKRGQRFYSGEISHGLGIGRVDIILSIKQGDSTFGGVSEIFGQEAPSLETGYQVNSRKGTFTIGVRLLEDVNKTEAEIGWLAVRNRGRQDTKKEGKRLHIKPAMVNMKVLEDYSLEVTGVNPEEEKVIWKMATPKGGMIDSDGTYHAPAEPGIYQVTAELEREPEVKASVYIVVRKD